MKPQRTPDQFTPEQLANIEERLRRLERRPSAPLDWIEYEPAVGRWGDRVEIEDSHARAWWANAYGMFLLHGLFIPGPTWTATQVDFHNTWADPDFIAGTPIYISMPLLTGWRLPDPASWGTWMNRAVPATSTPAYHRQSSYSIQCGSALAVKDDGTGLVGTVHIDDNRLYWYDDDNDRLTWTDGHTRNMFISLQQSEIPPSYDFVTSVSTRWPGVGDLAPYRWRIVWSIMLPTARYDVTRFENPYVGRWMPDPHFDDDYDTGYIHPPPDAP